MRRLALLCTGEGRCWLSGKQEDDGEDLLARRGVYQSELAQGFTKSLKALGRIAEATVPAQLQLYMRDWCSGLTEVELNRKWTYKPLSGDKAKRWKVKQIYVARHYRVPLIEVDTSAPSRVWFLDVFRKDQRNQQEDIDRAISRAKQIREGIE